MLARLAHALSRILPSRPGVADKVAPAFARSFEGAGAGRRLRGIADQPSSLGASLQARGTLARRARGIVANNAHAASAVEAWASALVGTGIKPQSPIPGLAEKFETWTDDADADALTDFYGLQAAVVRSVIINGEAFVAMRDDGRIRQIDPEQIDPTITQDLGDGAHIVHGIEFDDKGRRVAYHVRRDAPGLPFGIGYETIRVPASQILHVFKPIFPGQIRGLSWFAPVLLRLTDYDRSVDAQLQRQLVAALFAGFITDMNGTAGGFEGEQQGSNLEGGLEPGTLKVLDPGQDVRFSDPAKVGAEVIDFLKITAREIAAGLGVPYFVVTGDLSDANYSSLRAGLVEWRRRVEALQHSVFVFQFCRPVWRNFVNMRALGGDPTLGGYFQNPAAFTAAKWITPRFDWVDPAKDTKAETDAINAGLMSRRQAVASRGDDIERLDAEIAEDQRRATSLGLTFPNMTPGAANDDGAAP